MATGLPKSPRPGRKLTAAINIPKSSDSTRFLEPKVPKAKPSSPLGEISSPKNSGPLPPTSPRPSTPNFHHVRSPYGSPDDHGVRRRRHTVSVVEPANVEVPTDRHNDVFPSFDMFDVPDDGRDIKEEFVNDRNEAEAENRQPIPVSSSFFQQALLDLKRRPSRGSQSSVDDEDTARSKGNAMSPRARQPLRSLPSIEISHIEENNEDYSLDIELNAQDDDDEKKLSNSAPDSFLHETRKSTIMRLQIARAKLSSSERALNKTSSIKPKDPHKHDKTLMTNNEKISTRPKSPRKSKQGVLLSVDTLPLGRQLRKWRSTEGSLPDLSTATASSDDVHHLVHSPFLSSPMLRRKASMPAVLSTSPKLKERSSLQDLESSFRRGEQKGKPNPANLSPKPALSTRRPKSAHASSTSMSTSSSFSSASGSPTSSPRSKQETTDQPVKPNRGHPHISPLSLKTVNQITQFITSAAASSSISGSSSRKNVLPDAVTLPPVLDSSGRLRVHRRRDDSMRLARQAVYSDHNEWMDNNNRPNGKMKAKSNVGFAEV